MSALKLDFEASTTLSLESQLNRLALEYVFIDNAVGALKDLIPNLLDKLKGVYASITSTSPDPSVQIKQIRSEFNKTKARILHAPYLNYKKTLISVPEGFKGNLVHYTETLTNIAPFVFEDANKVLSEYCFFLSAFITNKENKLSLKDHTDSFKGLSQRREKLSQEIAQFFDGQTDTSKTYLGDALDRFSDVEVFVDRMEKLGNQLKRQNIKEITFSVKKATDLLDLIIKDLQTNGVTKVSGSAAKNIAEGAYAVGQYVEFISIYRFKVEQMVSCCEKLIQKLDEIL